jgi:hypothetical protein
MNDMTMQTDCRWGVGRIGLRSLPLLGLITLLTSIGCNSSDVATREVRGVVTFAGGPPPNVGELTFAPLSVDAGLPRRPAKGSFGSDGHFTLTTFQEGDGVIPGTYSVYIACWREKPTLETKLTANFVPPDFTHEVVIDADAPEPIELTIDVPAIQK